jgi:hypothetical protein
MADIRVERKGTSIWPWVLGLLVAALLIWALVGLFGEEEAEEMQEVDSAQEVGAMLRSTPAGKSEGAPSVDAPSLLLLTSAAQG